MAARFNNCPHIFNIAYGVQAEIEKAKEVSQCAVCDSRGPNLWICLYRDCLKIGCGEAHNDHSTQHSKTQRMHCVHLNLSTLRAWCYLCEGEVFPEQGEAHPRELPPASPTGSPTPRANPKWSRLKRPDSPESSDSEDSDDDENKPRGLTGLQNIGNTCYMNSALQALSNSPPLTQFFLKCGAALVASRVGDRKPGLSRSYHRLVQEMWHKNRPGYVVPSSILYGIRNVHPIFRGYQQHDTQEFLRCFMDQLHEELKEPVEEWTSQISIPSSSILEESGRATCVDFSDDDSDKHSLEQQDTQDTAASSQSDGEYETCDSGVSERSSLTMDTVDSQDLGPSRSASASSKKRKLSRSPSPPFERMRSKLTSASCGAKSHVASGHSAPNRKKTTKHRSIISDVFDGKLLSSVQCLTCDRISNRVETFQDLSLPIPSRDHIHMLHKGSGSLTVCSDVHTNEQSWFYWVLGWFRSLFWGPTVSLYDCLGAFFSADELKGDNMYSCEKCNKLRTGVKYSKVISLPEVLTIHLKRFRHELMSSSKISSYVSFPLTQLDMRSYLHKNCTSEVTSYDLVSVICHHGTAGGGHYTCYSLNCQNQQWFEFDDQYVTQVSPETVQCCEAYVLFYRKSSEVVRRQRSQALELLEHSTAESSLMTFYISKQWLNKFRTFAEPGPIDNSDFLCLHGGLRPDRANLGNLMCTGVSQVVWEYLYAEYGGGPACNCLFVCRVCQQQQADLQQRVEKELELFMQLKKDFRNDDSRGVIYAIAMQWFRQWHNFVLGKDPSPPGPIDNSPIAYTTKVGQVNLRQGSDYAQLSEEMWDFFRGTYGGGPELVLRPTAVRGAVPPPSRSGSTGVQLSSFLESVPMPINSDSAVSNARVSPVLMCSSAPTSRNRFGEDSLTVRMAALSASDQTNHIRRWSVGSNSGNSSGADCANSASSTPSLRNRSRSSSSCSSREEDRFRREDDRFLREDDRFHREDDQGLGINTSEGHEEAEPEDHDARPDKEVELITRSNRVVDHSNGDTIISYNSCSALLPSPAAVNNCELANTNSQV